VSKYGQQPQQDMYGQQPYIYQQQPQQLIKMCLRCNSFAPKNSGQFCTTCGGAYQMLPPPSYENGGTCPHCRTPVPVGSTRFCTNCGKNFNAGIGGGINIGNVNLGAVGDVTSKLGLSMQKMIFASVAALGIIATFLKWYSYNEEIELFMKWSVVGSPNALNNGISNVSWLLRLIFAGVIAMAFMGDRQAPLSSNPNNRLLCIAFSIVGSLSIGFVSILIGIVKSDLREDYGYMYANMVSPSIGIYLALITILAIGVLPFLRFLEKQ